MGFFKRAQANLNTASKHISWTNKDCRLGVFSQIWSTSAVHAMLTLVKCSVVLNLWRSIQEPSIWLEDRPSSKERTLHRWKGGWERVARSVWIRFAMISCNEIQKKNLRIHQYIFLMNNEGGEAEVWVSAAICSYPLAMDYTHASNSFCFN